jgi:hypothetical protein
MATTYSAADDEATELLRAVIEEHFTELARLEPPLEIDVLMAAAGGDDESEKPAVTRFGFGVAAKVSVVGPVERSKGGADVRVVIDEARWQEADEQGRRAMLFGELMRVEPKRDRSGALKRDAYDRPVVRLRPYDWCVAGYRESVRVWGDFAVERRELNAVEDSLRQQDLPFITARAV